MSLTGGSDEYDLQGYNSPNLRILGRAFGSRSGERNPAPLGSVQELPDRVRRCRAHPGNLFRQRTRTLYPPLPRRIVNLPPWDLRRQTGVYERVSIINFHVYNELARINVSVFGKNYTDLDPQTELAHPMEFAIITLFTCSCEEFGQLPGFWLLACTLEGCEGPTKGDDNV